eukprot:1141211-Amphidinium_carterae.1
MSRCQSVIPSTLHLPPPRPFTSAQHTSHAIAVSRAHPSPAQLLADTQCCSYMPSGPGKT